MERKGNTRGCLGASTPGRRAGANLGWLVFAQPLKTLGGGAILDSPMRAHPRAPPRSLAYLPIDHLREAVDRRNREQREAKDNVQVGHC